MAITNDIKTGLKLAADAATDITQSIIEKGRLRARANRIKQVIKNDTDTRNQAYIELGKYYFENHKEDALSQMPESYEVVEKTTDRISKASKRYFELITQSDNMALNSENTEKIKQIVNEKTDEFKKNTNEKFTEISTKTKEKASQLSDKTKEKAKEITSDFADKAKSKFEDLKSFVVPNDDLDVLLSDDEESPDEFDF